MPLFIRVVSFFAIALVCAACNSSPATPPTFNGQRAMGYLRAQTEFGPRVPGTKAWADCRDYLSAHFDTLGMLVELQEFKFDDPYSGSKLDLVNIIASFRGGESDVPALLLVAHWDSRPRTDHPSDPSLADSAITGANDGASGVAVMMELANLLHQSPARSNVDLLLVDGEDWGKVGDQDFYLLGARHFAAQGLRDRYQFGIVIDMIGDSAQGIYREGYSEKFVKPVNDYVFQTASELGISTMIDAVRDTVLDDHLALNSGGIPCIVLIDFDYLYWHTDQDTPDKCSDESLANIGILLAHIIYNPSTWPSL